MQQEFRVGDIRPNPYRHIERYPMIPEKIEALEESFERTGFWDNIVVRVNADGVPEQAYGHHRVHALITKYGPDHRASFIVRTFDEEAMLKAMADENSEVYGANAAVDIETLRSLLDGWANGTFPKPVLSVTQRRHQYKSATAGLPIEYTAADVATFFGWKIDRRTIAAIAALESIVSGGMKIEAYEGASIRKAQEAAQAVNAAVKASKSSGDTTVVTKTREAVVKALRAETKGTRTEGGRTASEQAIKNAGQAALAAALPRFPKAQKTVLVTDTIAQVEAALKLFDRAEIRSRDGSINKLTDLIEEIAKHPELGHHYRDVADLLTNLSQHAARLAALFTIKQIGKGK